jgi:hypothetical protein
MTTPSPRRCFAPPSIGRSSRSRGLPIWRPPENGARASCNGTTTNTAIVASATSPQRSVMPGRMAPARCPPRRLPGRTATQPATLEWVDPQLDTNWRRHPQSGARHSRSGGNVRNPAFQFDRRTCFPTRPDLAAPKPWRAPDLLHSEHRGTLITSRKSASQYIYATSTAASSIGKIIAEFNGLHLSHSHRQPPAPRTGLYPGQQGRIQETMCSGTANGTEPSP